MTPKTLIILTHEFPVVKRGEPWLAEEVKHISGNWDGVKLFCDSNLTERSTSTYPQLDLLPNSFIYKRRWSAFLNKAFFSALSSEYMELLRKGKLLKVFGYSTSSLLRAYSKAVWFNETYLEKNKHYLLYSYWGDESATMACLLKSMNSKITVVCRGHGMDVFEEQTKFKHIPFRPFQLKKIVKMFLVSQSGADHIKAKYPVFAKKIETSYLGTEENGLNPVPANPCFELVSCAKIRSVKRLELVVEILKHTKAHVRWTVIGNGPDYEKLQELCKSLPVNVSVELLGYKSTQEIVELYKTKPFHYYISVSSSEGLPVSMMESISYGIPVISTDVGGCKEIVNSVTGVLLSQDFDPKTVAEQLTELFTTYDYSTAKREKIHAEWDKKFNAVKNYEAFYKKLSELN